MIGSQSFNVGIALPSFLIKKENNVIIMGVVLVLIVIILPAFLIHYQS
jgi:preprotein translocase subunit Sec63